ncbi:uncharacterized protein N7459_000049 [Penicillium hispanicum]|uniref:uncharacterized protein n=1 Tax=Penicillium hispanicum TaxID=1080232 RepID=UPI0025413A58|nr:uncharacterized protein N7459_000049 [Penicillium hispanicum]KAJ5593841.1 hypothetical protein N7459_000049 [Penicillium hispanicum]
MDAYSDRRVRQVQAATDAVVRDFGRLDVMIANAGIPSKAGGLEDKLEDWQRVVNVDFSGAYYCARVAGHIFRQQGSGSMIFTASMSGHAANVPQQQACYNACKAGVIHLAKSLAVEWAGFARVNCVSPGYIDTPISGDCAYEMKEEWYNLTPLKRDADPRELKGVYLYLASDAIARRDRDDPVTTPALQPVDHHRVPARMAPRLYLRGRSSDFHSGQTSQEFLAQWKNPSDVFSVLLILGGDVINRALAQLAGTGICPVTFSFGWVAYAVSAVTAAVGENRLMPAPDCSCKVINAKSMYSRDNQSWIIGRLVRDFDSWRDPEIHSKLEEMLERKWEENQEAAERKAPGSGQHLSRPDQAGLCVSIYRAEDANPGFQGRDLAYYSGFIVAVLQMGVAAIPCGIWRDWSILFITACGIFLSFMMGSLPQWTKEKWACRKDNVKKTLVLVRGNGCQHAIVIRCQGRGLDLEDLATGPINVEVNTSLFTRAVIIGLAFLWILLLVTASGIQQNTWFLLAVGGLGILQNIFVAGRARDPAAFGVPLSFEEVIVETKVMKTLYGVEEKYPMVGRSMLDTFFPGDNLRADEKAQWEKFATVAKAKNPK